MVLRALHLCSGYGGFELALRGYARTVGHVERDAYAAATLVARMAEARLDPAPVWDDLCTFDARAWRGCVDLITAGFPCQPFSSAGKKLGIDDDRWLWPDIERIIADVEPRYVFLENVPGVVRHGLPEVLHSLAQLGFDAEWGLLSASAVGAPHKRERFWLVGHASRSGRSEVTRSAHGDEGPHGPQHSHVADSAGEDVADTAGVDEREPHHPGRPVARGDARPDIGRHRFPPHPDDHAGWAEWDGAQPAICRSTDGATRWLADALHLGGNGLVPQCARAAWEQLIIRLNRQD